MNNYIYEMDLTNLRISYILPEGLNVFKVQTTLYNWTPYDRSRLEIKYEVHITDNGNFEEHEFFQSFEGGSLQEITEKIRRYFIEHPYQQSHVSKSPEDGTDSVITA